MISKLEIRRQALHICIGIIVLILFYINLLGPLRIFIIIIIGCILSLLSKRFRIPVLSWFLDKFERKDDKALFPGRGLIYFFIGVLLVIKLFSKDIAMASIVVLTFGDSIVQMSKGKIKYPSPKKRFLEGILSGLVVSFVIALFFVSPLEAFAAALAGMAAETFVIEMNRKPIDDNIIVPLVAGTAIHLIRLFL